MGGRDGEPPVVLPVGELDAALRGARAGDEEAFRVLWRALQPPLVRYLTVRGNAAPDDVAAETWLQVVRDLDRFRGGVPEFRAWLFTVARNRAVDQARRLRAAPVVPLAEPPEPDVRAPSAEDGALERAATAAALRRVARLPPDQAEMVMLRVVAGLDVAAVARIVGKQPGTVRVAVHRALRTLARLEPPEGGPR